MMSAAAEASAWDFGWEALVALATFLLAVVTAVLAWKTSQNVGQTKELAAETQRLVGITEEEVRAVEKQAEAATDEVAVSRAALEAGVRPILMEARTVDLPADDDRPFWIRESPGSLVVVVWLRNVGEGIAFLREAVLGGEDGDRQWTMQASAGAVPRAEVVRLTLSVDVTEGGDLDAALEFAELRNRGEFSIRVEYADLAGNVWATRLDAGFRRLIQTWVMTGVVLEALGKTSYVGWSGRPQEGENL